MNGRSLGVGKDESGGYICPDINGEAPAAVNLAVAANARHPLRLCVEGAKNRVYDIASLTF